MTDIYFNVDVDDDDDDATMLTTHGTKCFYTMMVMITQSLLSTICAVVFVHAAAAKNINDD